MEPVFNFDDEERTRAAIKQIMEYVALQEEANNLAAIPMGRFEPDMPGGHVDHNAQASIAELLGTSKQDTGAPILVIDDEDPMRLLLNCILEANGYSCVLAANADEARERMNAQDIGLALCDLNMPGESGLDLIRSMKDSFPDTAIIMVSANDDPQQVYKALELGAYGYVIKPFKTSELLINIANALRRRRLEIENRQSMAKIEQALSIAKEIQEGFLPKCQLNLPGIEVAGRSISCDATCGDYYDYVQLGDRQVAFAIGDVIGHGVGSALLMAGTRAFLRALIQEVASPEETLQKVNNLLTQDVGGERFVTLFYGVLDTQTLVLRFSSAGHDYPILYRPQTDEFLELASTGPPLGVVDDADFGEGVSLQTYPGDLIVFNTDGIWEAANPEGEALGRLGLKNAIRRYAKESIGKIIDSIFDEVRAHIGEAPQADDLTLMVARIRG